MGKWRERYREPCLAPTGTSLFDLGLTCFAIKVAIGFRKVEVSKTSQLGVITANQLNKQGIKEFQLDAEKYSSY